MDDTISISIAKTPLNFGAEIFSAGLKGARRAWPAIETQTVSLFDKGAGLTPSWKPHWTKVPTVGLTFPLGFEFQPKTDEVAEKDGLKKIAGPKVAESD